MQFTVIKLDVEEGIATITLADPATMNGLSIQMLRELAQALAQIRERADVYAVILTGTGKAFCSGANLTEGTGRVGNDASYGDAVGNMMENHHNPLVMALRNLPVPIVAAVNGAAAGAGMGLALAADIVIAGHSAFFQAPFLPRLGLLPDMGTSWLLPRHLGRARSMGLMLLGDRLPAQHAADWGLIWECVDDDRLMPHARETGLRLASGPSHAVTEARAALDVSETQCLEWQLDYERKRQRHLATLPSLAEGVRAFFEKRAPVFKKTGEA